MRQDNMTMFQDTMGHWRKEQAAADRAPVIKKEKEARLDAVRGCIYGGAVGYIDFTGNLDTCIGIRLAYKKNDKIFIRSGAGIVADSVPEKEYQECLNKAASVVKAIHEAEEEV